jgi:hypothetical protein
MAKPRKVNIGNYSRRNATWEKAKATNQLNKSGAWSRNGVRACRRELQGIRFTIVVVDWAVEYEINTRLADRSVAGGERILMGQAFIQLSLPEPLIICCEENYPQRLSQAVSALTAKRRGYEPDTFRWLPLRQPAL